MSRVWEGEPGALEDHVLCARYVLVWLCGVRIGGTARTDECRSLVWTLGLHEEGQWQLLGAWDISATAYHPAQRLLADLWERGVERIDQAVVVERVVGRSGCRPSQPWIGHWSHSSALGTGRRAAGAYHVARRLHAAMVRASTRRRGGFDSVTSAQACLSQQWRRLQRQAMADAGPTAAARPSARLDRRALIGP